MSLGKEKPKPKNSNIKGGKVMKEFAKELMPLVRHEPRSVTVIARGIKKVTGGVPSEKRITSDKGTWTDRRISLELEAGNNRQHIQIMSREPKFLVPIKKLIDRYQRTDPDRAQDPPEIFQASA